MALCVSIGRLPTKSAGLGHRCFRKGAHEPLRLGESMLPSSRR
jgi:hypothetical protein